MAMRTFEQSALLVMLLEEQRETNRLLRVLTQRGGSHA